MYDVVLYHAIDVLKQRNVILEEEIKPSPALVSQQVDCFIIPLQGRLNTLGVQPQNFSLLFASFQSRMRLFEACLAAPKTFKIK